MALCDLNGEYVSLWMLNLVRHKVVFQIRLGVIVGTAMVQISQRCLSAPTNKRTHSLLHGITALVSDLHMAPSWTATGIVRLVSTSVRSICRES